MSVDPGCNLAPSAPVFEPPPYPDDPPPPYSAEDPNPLPQLPKVDTPLLNNEFINPLPSDNQQPTGESTGDNEISAVPCWRKCPWTIYIVGVIDIVFNIVYLILSVVDFVEDELGRFYTNIFGILISLLWLRASTKLIQSGDYRKPVYDRKVLTISWKRINYALMIILGLTAFASYIYF